MAEKPLPEELAPLVKALVRRFLRAYELKQSREVQKDLKFIQNQLQGVDTKFSLLLEQVQKRFEALQLQIQQQFEAIDKRFETVDKRFEAIQSQFERRFEAIDKRFEALQREMSLRFEVLQREMDKRFEASQREMDRRFEAINRRLDFLQWYVGGGLIAIFLTLVAQIVLRLMGLSN